MRGHSILVVLAPALLAAQPVRAQSGPADCELHIWPTTQTGAVFHGASVVYAPGGYGLDMTLTPLHRTAETLAKAVRPEDQERIIRDMALDKTGRFASYRLVFHAAPATSKYANWIDRKIALGGRDTDSKSPCYAEIHIVFITLFRTALSKKIQTGFVYRQFGDKAQTVLVHADAGSTGAPAFPADGEPPSPEGVADVQAAFRENLAILLRKKKLQRP